MAPLDAARPAWCILRHEHGYFGFTGRRGRQLRLATLCSEMVQPPRGSRCNQLEVGRRDPCTRDIHDVAPRRHQGPDAEEPEYA
jgi:hypothetical protein